MIHLEKLTADKIHLLRKWRNHDRACFRDTSLITHKQQEEWFVRNTRDMRYWYFVVYKKGVPVGCMGFSIIGTDEMHIENVILGEKEYRGQGIMGEALRMMMGIFPFKKFSLKVLTGNRDAIRFYKANHFAIASEEDGCYIMIKSD